MFNQRQNRKFNYKTRFSETKEDDLDKELRDKWDELRKNSKRKGNFLTSFPLLVLFLIIAFVLIYILNTYIN